MTSKLCVADRLLSVVHTASALQDVLTPQQQCLCDSQRTQRVEFERETHAVHGNVRQRLRFEHGRIGSKLFRRSRGTGVVNQHINRCIPKIVLELWNHVILGDVHDVVHNHQLAAVVLGQGIQGRTGFAAEAIHLARALARQQLLDDFQTSPCWIQSQE